MPAYPLLLDLAGRRTVVVGGGPVALRRARGLLDAGADVHVVAPEVTGELAGAGVTVHRRRYADGDLDGSWLAHACTDDPAVNAAVAAEAERRGVFCVRADTGDGTRVPAVARAAGVTIAVGTDPEGPADPGRVAAIRDAVAFLLAAGDLPLRPQRAPGRGRVSLVGGGPGDPELITVRGRRLLAEADVVVVDRLAPRQLLDTLAADVEVVDAGKTPHGRGPHGSGPTQAEISGVLVDRALAGKRVVRLKGGDPFVFGRGGEEMLACLRAGVPVDVVPGVSSALAGPAAAGIPVTHRGVASDVAVVTGHLDPSRPGASVDWQALAEGPSTLVLLMAVEKIDQIATELVKRGRPGDTPVAAIRNATLPDQQVVVGSLDTIAADIARHALRPPAVIVVGEVVRLAGIDGGR